MAVSKPNGAVRICGDSKALNRQLEVDQDPLPTLDCIMERLQGGQYFSKIDLADAYLQLELEDDTKKLCVINTLFGLLCNRFSLFVCKRNVWSVPECVQQDVVLQG